MTANATIALSVAGSTADLELIHHDTRMGGWRQTAFLVRGRVLAA
jgi:hypothetical protein